MRATNEIPPQFFLGTAQHEANFATNEIDTEENGYVSMGVWQMSDDELAGADPYDLESSTRAFAKLMVARKHAMADFAREHGILELPAPDWMAYLAIAHNQGLAAVEKTIAIHGMDWAGYKRRNPTIAIVRSGYGDDVITGGERWKDVKREGA